jgi:hypothetical protein
MPCPLLATAVGLDCVSPLLFLLNWSLAFKGTWVAFAISIKSEFFGVRGTVGFRYTLVRDQSCLGKGWLIRSARQSRDELLISISR